MPLPAQRTVFGSLADLFTGTGPTTTITVTALPRRWTDEIGDQLLVSPDHPVPVVAGEWTVDLVPTDTAGIEPATGKYYRFTEVVAGVPRRSRTFEVPTGDMTPVSILALVVADPGLPGYVRGAAGPAGPPGSNADAEAYTDAALADEVVRANAAYETPAGATGKVTAHTGASDPHGDRADAATRYLTKAVWRRRDLPDLLTVEALYAGAAPTIGTAQTTTPTAGYIKNAPAGVALAGSDVTGPFRYAGAGSMTIGAGAPDTSYVLPLSKYPNTYASGQSTWSVEFGTDAATFQVRFKHISSATMYRLSIDGRRVTDLMQSAGGITPGSGHLITIGLGSATPRRIRLDFATFPFGGIYVPPGASVWQVPLDGGRLMVLGDSLPDGSSMSTGGGHGTWFGRTARHLGCDDGWEQGRGGTGYVTAGAFATLINRVPLDVVAPGPDRLIIWAGYNDSATDQTALGTAAAALYAAVQAGLPNCQTTVIGCWSPTGSPGTSLTNTDVTLRLAAAAAGFPFISPITGAVYNGAGTLVATHGPWITGTGRVGATTGSGNADGYIGTDAVHPTDAGHAYVARRITAALRELMPA
ncbi:SGNH/GDSL hydrolase family protein [Streptomyces sp. NPDC058674]|uniref:SGNH/GDSL hydrolase family protein n=1 Tax=Streptomyces sp. NPDC058674 TaxID=3346592 RepID=UPI00365AFB1C